MENFDRTPVANEDYKDEGLSSDAQFITITKNGEVKFPSKK